MTELHAKEKEITQIEKLVHATKEVGPTRILLDHRKSQKLLKSLLNLLSSRMSHTDFYHDRVFRCMLYLLFLTYKRANFHTRHLPM